MNSSPLASEWLDQLQASGYRVTGPRRAIVELMAESQRALGPIDVYDMGRADYPGLGLVTVYRTLEKLEELGLVQRVHLPDGCHRYLRATQGHQHLLLCTVCGLVEYFSGDDLNPLTGRVASDTGFSVKEHWLQLFGQCPACRAGV
jgi:Fe2+ or Zn2+ uptake regulation protein